MDGVEGTQRSPVRSHAADRGRGALRGGPLSGGGPLRGLRLGRRLSEVIAAALLLAAMMSATAWATDKAPAITKQPVNKTVEEGQSAIFESTASGTPTPTVQWERSTDGGVTWNPIEGATATQLIIASAKRTESANQFRAVFRNTLGAATSKVATLTVRKAPVVTKQPASTTVEEGQAATFEAIADGFPAPTVQWQTSANGGASWANVSGATSTQLTLTNVKTSLNGHLYRAVFTNVAGKATSEAATLTVQNAPAVTKQPASTTVNEGQDAVFESTASGFPAPTEQWEVSTDGGATWSPIEGATSSQLTIASTTAAQDGNRYRAVFTSPAGSVTSEAATLSVHAPPVVTQGPASMTVEQGEPAVFEATASGFPAPTEQWEISTDGGATWSVVPGATSSQLTIAETQLSESGHEYRATFTNVAGQATTGAATLTVATSNFSAVAWGQNLLRQLGNGSTNSFSKVPVLVSGLKFVTSVAAGGTHSLALLANGTVMGWGGNEHGQVGDGTTLVKDVPIAVEGLSGVKAIAAGGNHSLALLNNGTVMAWGDNESGQLGDGTLTDREAPVSVKGLSNVRAIAAGGNHSLALLNNGTAMAWGANESGQLGTGSLKTSTVPVAVKGLTGVTQLSAGAEYSLALLGTGNVEAWGSDEYGQLGNAGFEEPNSDLPIAVSGLSGATQVAAGATHALALLSSGTVMAWGQDSYGEIGNGTIQARQETPVAVSGLSGVTKVSAGRQDSVALLGAGRAMTWGINQYGTLGNGTSGSPSSVPVLVSGLRQVADVSAGGSHMLAFGEPIPTVTEVSPNRGPVAGGTTVTISGTDLDGGATVRFGANEATGVTVNSSSSITATAPPGTGTVDVIVSTASGTSPPSSTDRFTYVAPPTLTKLSPKLGSAAGGTTVTITGSSFIGVTSVAFGSVEAASFTVNSSTSITAVTPAELEGTVDVRVTTEFGTTPVSTADRFKFVPTVTGVSPNGGPAAGGTSVTVTGTGFLPGTGGTLFSFGAAKAKSVNCASTTECTMLSPAHEAGTVDVKATANKVASPKNAPADQFTYS
jgi:alpha-tubulin suppressor-like RCC1 family protein